MITLCIYLLNPVEKVLTCIYFLLLLGMEYHNFCFLLFTTLLFSLRRISHWGFLTVDWIYNANCLVIFLYNQVFKLNWSWSVLFSVYCLLNIISHPLSILPYYTQTSELNYQAPWKSKYYQIIFHFREGTFDLFLQVVKLIED